MGMRFAGFAGALLLYLSAAPVAASELSIDLRKPWVRPGGRICARAELTLDGVYLSGRWPVRWIVTDSEGRTIASGRKIARFRDERPYRFKVRARVPKSVKYDIVLLHVAIVDDEWNGSAITVDWMASVPVLVYRRGLKPIWERETMTGTIVDGPLTPRFVPEGSSIEEGSFELYGSGVHAIRANPARDGARVTITGRLATEPGMAYPAVASFPHPFIVEEASFLDPRPAPIRWNPLQTQLAHIPARIAPADLVGILAWRRLLLDARTPRVLRTREEFNALNAAMSEDGDGPLDRLADADFDEEMIVVVFAGFCPTRDYRVNIVTPSYDEATGTTWIEYAVTGPRKKEAGPAEWVEPFHAMALPANPGPVEFERTEWIPDRPAWW